MLEMREQICTVSLGRAPVPLYIMPVSAGFETVRNRKYDWEGLKRGSAPFALIQHTISGTGKLRFLNKEYTLRAGDTMVLTFPTDHRYWLPPGGEWQIYWACLNGREAMRIFNKVIAERGPVLHLSNKAIDKLASYCTDLLMSAYETPMDASAATYETVMTVANSLQGLGDMEQLPGYEGIAAATAFISGNLNKAITIDELAEIAGYSRFHFCRVFRETHGLSPANYIQRARLSLAVQMLQGNNSSIKRVSHACGFSDPNYFAKCFRKSFGVSPTAFLTAGPTERGIILQGLDQPAK